MVQWADFDWEGRMFASCDETLLSKTLASVENGYHNPAGGLSRFPGMTMFSEMPGNRVYLTEFRGNLIAGTDRGRFYRIDQDGQAEDVTGVPISGGKRIIFSATEDQLVMAAGGPILQLVSDRTSLLSVQAPQSTHVAFIDGYLLAIEPNSGRFQFCDPGAYTTWNPLSVFSANGKADDLNALAVSPYREILLVGEDSVEQYDTLANGNQPFARRWTSGAGVYAPYTLVTDQSGVYGVNKRLEFTRFAGQVMEDQSADVNLVLQKVNDWTDAWAQECSIKGQKFIILQAPMATNAYGTEGITLLLDYRARRWSFLYGWDDVRRLPARWPGWSIQRLWGRMFVGVPGGVAELKDDTYQLFGKPFPFLIRSGHVDKFASSRFDDVEIRIRRGDGANNPTATEPRIAMRVNRDGMGFDQWMFESMGRPGDRQMTMRWGAQGVAETWQFEMAVTDNIPIEFTSMRVLVERMRH